MVLQSSGQISLGNACTEYGVAESNVSFSSFYGMSTLPSSGRFGLSNFYGQSAAPAVPTAPILNKTFRLQDITSGLFVDFNEANNGVLSTTGTYLQFQRPSGIYDPNSLGSWALCAQSGALTGSCMRHAGYVVHLSGFVDNNFDFAWVFQQQSANSFLIYNYYDYGYYLDYNGTNVLISTSIVRRWAIHS
jgi:hypothetical protein